MFRAGEGQRIVCWERSIEPSIVYLGRKRLEWEMRLVFTTDSTGKNSSDCRKMYDGEKLIFTHINF
jgi:hypothetical protein